MYVCMRAYVDVCASVRMCIEYVCLHVCMHMYTCECMHVCTCVCLVHMYLETYGQLWIR